MAMLCRLASTRTMPLAPTPTTIRGVSARGTYQRRAELGLPSSGNFGNGGAWAASASALGYWVDNTPRHVGDAVVFAPGQADADGAYGHVAVLEKINADGSIEISESNAKGLGVISTRTFSAAEAGKFQYVHY